MHAGPETPAASSSPKMSERSSRRLAAAEGASASLQKRSADRSARQCCSCLPETQRCSPLDFRSKLLQVPALAQTPKLSHCLLNRDSVRSNRSAPRLSGRLWKPLQALQCALGGTKITRRLDPAVKLGGQPGGRYACIGLPQRNKTLTGRSSARGRAHAVMRSGTCSLPVQKCDTPTGATACSAHAAASALAHASACKRQHACFTLPQPQAHGKAAARKRHCTLERKNKEGSSAMKSRTCW